MLRRILCFLCFTIAAVALLLGTLSVVVRLLGPSLWAVLVTLGIYVCFLVSTASCQSGERRRG